LAGTEERASVRREGDGINRAGVAGEGPQFATGGHVPQLHRPVKTSRQRCATVARKSDGINVVRVDELCENLRLILRRRSRRKQNQSQLKERCSHSCSSRTPFERPSIRQQYRINQTM